jgi:hypothetical protein
VAGKTFWKNWFDKQLRERIVKAQSGLKKIKDRIYEEELSNIVETLGVEEEYREKQLADRNLERAKARSTKADETLKARVQLSLMHEHPDLYKEYNKVKFYNSSGVIETLAGAYANAKAEETDTAKLVSNLQHQRVSAMDAFEAALTPKQYQMVALALADEYDLEMPDDLV